MRSFCENIYTTLGSIVADVGFRKTPQLISEGDYCVLVRRYSNQVALYIFCQDCRSKGGDVTVTLWVAPLEFPDDRIEVLNIGVKIIFYSSYDVSDDEMKYVGRKIVDFITCIPNIATFVEREIDKPYIVNKRTKWFLYSKEMLQKLFEEENFKIKSEFQRLLDETENCVLGKISLEKLEYECSLFLDTLPDGYFSNEISSLSVKNKGSLLAPVLYAETIFSSMSQYE